LTVHFIPTHVAERAFGSGRWIATMAAHFVLEWSCVVVAKGADRLTVREHFLAAPTVERLVDDKGLLNCAHDCAPFLPALLD
jgi:hypothetical protein